MISVLVACEESQVVTTALREEGIQAFSCDVEPCTGAYPEWHIQNDVTPFIDCGWTAIIAFPPCTHLASSGARWFKEKRADGRQQRAIEFFMRFARADCDNVAIENPIGIMSNAWRKPDQIIQPWQYGHGESKATCLWLKGFPKLKPTRVVEERYPRVWLMAPSKTRGKERSKTYEGIALAMAKQWGDYLKRRYL